MSDTVSEGRAANLLWTGGWDSTFQLIRLLLEQRRRVRPFYLIDTDRPSIGRELLTMKRIQDYLFENFPHTRQMLEPCRYFAVADIAPDAEITETYRAIRKRQFMGRQYEWLARFCKHNAIEDMQLCIHCEDKAHAVIEKLVHAVPDGAGSVLRMNAAFSSTEEFRLFRHYTFPVLDLRKTQMGEIALWQGWRDIMEMTWFCQTPGKNMKPCGRCNPCVYTIEEGLGWRVPLAGRLRFAFRRSIVKPSKLLAKGLLHGLGLRQRLKPAD